MSSTKNNFKLITAKATVSLLGIGYIYPASATWGSLATGILLYFSFPLIAIPIKIIIISATFIIGTFTTSYILKNTKKHDPHFVVIDEIVGMMIVCLFLQQIWWHFLLAFILFRIFDIAKLWPASVYDKKEGSFSVMFDDVLMALPALGVLHLIIGFF